MTQFRFTADVQFEAEDLDQAFALLATHFAALGASVDLPAWFTGEMNLSGPRQPNLPGAEVFDRWREFDIPQAVSDILHDPDELDETIAVALAYNDASDAVARVEALCERRKAEHADYVQGIHDGTLVTLDRFTGPAQVNVADVEAALRGDA